MPATNFDTFQQGDEGDCDSQYEQLSRLLVHQPGDQRRGPAGARLHESFRMHMHARRSLKASKLSRSETTTSLPNGMPLSCHGRGFECGREPGTLRLLSKPRSV